MGLFGGLLKGITQVLSPIGGAIIGGHDNKKAIGKANDALQTGFGNASGALTGQLATDTTNYAPYTSNGALAINQEGDILGLHGNDAQSSAISGVQDSPLFKSIFNTGQNSVLSAASATGGLRGGNVNEALAENGENSFATTLQNLLTQLGGISGQGLTATGQLANFGAGTAAGVAGLDTQSGSANAGEILGKQSVDNNTISQLQKIIASAMGGGGGGIASAIGGAAAGGAF